MVKSMSDKERLDKIISTQTGYSRKEIKQLAKKLQDLTPQEQLKVIETLQTLPGPTLEEDMNAVIQENLPALKELAK